MTLIPESDKVCSKKESYQPVPVRNIGVQILNKILVNKILQSRGEKS